MIFIGAVLAFQPALHNEFSHDDVRQVKELAVPGSAGAWAGAWLQPWWPADEHKNLWRPVTRLTILAQKVMAPGAPWTFYGFNILLHGAVGLLLFRAARRLGLGEWAAGAGALIFALHPIHAEAVHQVVGRAELLAAFWMLLGVGSFARRGLADRRSWVIQPLVFALALGSKEHAVVYPLIIMVMSLCGAGGEGRMFFDRRLLGRMLGMMGLLGLLGLVLALFLAVKMVVTGGLLEPASAVALNENVLAGWGLMKRLPAVLGIFAYAVSRLVWPRGLSPDYSALSLPLEDGWAWGWSWAGAMLIAGLIIYGWRNWRNAGRGWGLALAGLAAWGLISNGPFIIGTVTAERLWYWPSAAACLGLGWLIARVRVRLGEPGRRGMALAFACVMLLLLSASWAYGPAWRTQKDLAWATVERFPNSWRGNINLAREYYREKNFEPGLARARRAVRVLPEMGIGWDWLGLNATLVPECGAEANAAFARALQLDPALHKVHYHWASLLKKEGQRRRELEELKTYQLHATESADQTEVAQRIGELEVLEAAAKTTTTAKE